MPFMPRTRNRLSTLGVPRGVSAEEAADLLARVRADYRRALSAAALALAAAICGHVFGRSADHGVGWITAVCAAGFAIFGVGATRMVANEASRVATLRAGTSAAGPIRVGLLLTGYTIVLLVSLDMLQLPLGHLLVGGAITGIILGIAAQQSLGNLFAGLVLLFTRPYVPGQRVIVRSGALNGPLTGAITGVGLLYTTLELDGTYTNIPNSALLASAVGPAPADEASEHQAPGPQTTGMSVRDSGLMVLDN